MKDFIYFLKNIEWADYEMLRGMEIVRHNHEPSRCDHPYTFKINKWWELFYFFIDRRYEGEVTNALGRARRLYIGVPNHERLGTYYYFAPIAWVLKSRKYFRRVWMAPFAVLYDKGYIHLPPGERPSLLWWRYLQVESKTAPKE